MTLRQVIENKVADNEEMRRNITIMERENQVLA